MAGNVIPQPHRLIKIDGDRLAVSLFLILGFLKMVRHFRTAQDDSSPAIDAADLNSPDMLYQVGLMFAPWSRHAGSFKQSKSQQHVFV